MPRQPKARPISVEITPSAGRWHGFVPVGVKANGRPDRIHRSVSFCADCKVEPTKDCAASCYRRCEDEIRKVEASLAAGDTPIVDRDPWADQYFTTWLAGRRDEIEYGTWKSYSTVVRLYLVPNVKGKRLRQTNTVAGLKALLATVKADVSAQAARKTLRVLRKALNDAVRDKFIGRSEAQFVPMPTLDTNIEEVQPLSRDEALAILPVIMDRGDAARWLLGMLHGPRQGECLGLMTRRPEDRRIPSDVDLEAGTFTIREKIQRRTWEHGCADPHACGERLHKTAPCPKDCRRHTRACPPPCAKDCTGHASSCPQRTGGGLVRGKPKTKKGARTADFEPVVWQAFRDYAQRQVARRALAGSKWVDTGFFFTDDFGRPIDPKRDWDAFQSILAAADLPPARVHALRHTTATFLLAAGVQKRVVMELLGWSQDMTPVYQHPTDQMKRDATKAVGAYLWPAETTTPEPRPDPVDPGSATGLLPDDLGKVLPFRRKAV